eukprot:1827283-Pleurochrysis_carterae.AAC.1
MTNASSRSDVRRIVSQWSYDLKNEQKSKFRCKFRTRICFLRLSRLQIRSLSKQRHGNDRPRAWRLLRSSILSDTAN